VALEITFDVPPVQPSTLPVLDFAGKTSPRDHRSVELTHVSGEVAPSFHANKRLRESNHKTSKNRLGDAISGFEVFPPRKPDTRPLPNEPRLL